MIEAFQQKGNEGLVNALDKMQSKGRMSITGTLGYDIAYAKTVSATRWNYYVAHSNQSSRFALARSWADTPVVGLQPVGSGDYRTAKDKKKAKGTLYPAAKLKMNKQGQMELELYQNPWKLVNIMRR